MILLDKNNYLVLSENSMLFTIISSGLPQSNRLPVMISGLALKSAGFCRQPKQGCYQLQFFKTPQFCILHWPPIRHFLQAITKQRKTIRIKKDSQLFNGVLAGGRGDRQMPPTDDIGGAPKRCKYGYGTCKSIIEMTKIINIDFIIACLEKKTCIYTERCVVLSGPTAKV